VKWTGSTPRRTRSLSFVDLPNALCCGRRAILLLCACIAAGGARARSGLAVSNTRPAVPDVRIARAAAVLSVLVGIFAITALVLSVVGGGVMAPSSSSTPVTTRLALGGEPVTQRLVIVGGELVVAGGRRRRRRCSSGLICAVLLTSLHRSASDRRCGGGAHRYRGRGVLLARAPRARCACA
jgi:hypothetical protein